MNQLDATTEFINQHLTEQWQSQKLTPAPRCTDEEFLRRASLDIIGRIPTVDEVLGFNKDNAADKRAKLIDRLLAGEDYAAYWARTWTSWLLPRTVATTVRSELIFRGVGCKDSVYVPGHMPAPEFYRLHLELWLDDQFVKNTSHKLLVESLLAAKGKTNENQAVNFILAQLGGSTPAGRQAQEGAYDVVPITSRSIRLFLGYQIQGSQFEDDPVRTDWKQKHFWGINVFFRQVERIGQVPQANPQLIPQKNQVMELRDNPNFNQKGIIFYEKRNGVLLPSEPIFLDGRRIPAGGDGTRREKLARLVTSHKNFNHAAVSRMWGQFFGRGFNAFPAVDDFGEHNEVVLPELLDRLAKDFADGGHDYKKLIRSISASDAYQLMSMSNNSNMGTVRESYFGRKLLYLLSPEQLVESLCVAVQPGAADRKAIQQQAASCFGQRFEGNEWDDVPFEDKLVYLQRFLNRKGVAEAVLSPEGGTLAIASAKRDQNAALEHLYLATLGRRPAQQEMALLEIEIAKALKSGEKNLGQVWQDMLWALLNSSEFVLNH